MQRANQQKTEQSENIECAQFQRSNLDRLCDDDERHDQIKEILYDRHVVDPCQGEALSNQIGDETDVAGTDQYMNVATHSAILKHGRRAEDGRDECDRYEVDEQTCLP